MRCRRGTFYMRESPYKKSSSTPATPTTPTSTARARLNSNPVKYTPEYVASVFDSFGPISECKGKDAFSGDYQSPCKALHDNLSTASTSIEGFHSRTVSRLSVDEFLDEIEPEPRASKLFRAMVIGAKNTEKYSLVNALYPVEECDILQDEVKFDLVMRTIDKDTLLERYHFWLKEAGEVERIYRPLLDVYYKTCAAFFLVYNEDDKKSFECLEKEIDMIKEAIGSKEVPLVLICNQDRRGRCRVKQEEVLKFVEKYKIQMTLDGEGLFTRQEEVKEMISSLMK